MRCLAHIINLTTQEILKYVKAGEASNGNMILEDNSKERDIIPRLRNLIIKINSSPQRMLRFSQHLNIFPNLKSLSLIQDVKTRWNSTFLMLKRALELREVIVNLYFIMIFLNSNIFFLIHYMFYIGY